MARAPESTGSLAEAAPAEDAGSCIKVRRRLWVEGEGWIVRRVGICR